MSFTSNFLKELEKKTGSKNIAGGTTPPAEKSGGNFTQNFLHELESRTAGSNPLQNRPLIQAQSALGKKTAVIDPAKRRAQVKVQERIKNHNWKQTMREAESAAKDAEKEYEDFLNSEEYATMLDRKGIMQLPGNELFGLLTGYSRQEEDRLKLREQQLRRKAEQLRSVADQYKEQDIYQNAEILAEQADAELEQFLHSEEYAAWTIARDKKKADAAAMAEISGNPAFFPSVWDKNDREQELRANAEYYHRVVNSKKEQAMMEKDLQELAGWSKEDQDALKVYALGAYQTVMARPEEAAAFAAGNSPEGLFRKYGAQRVKEIAESYMRSQSQETRQMVATAAQEGAESGLWAGVGHSLASVGANLAGSLTGPLGYLAEAAGRTGRYTTLDPNNPGQLMGTYAGAVRQEVAGNIQDAGFGKAGATVYQAGMSALDNLARMVAGGGTGSLALAATGSFGQAVSQYSSQGATPMEAVAMGIINGSLEVLTEKMSLDNILEEMAQPKTGIQMLKAALRAGGIEVTEEEMSFLGSALAEAAVLREKSGYNQQVAMLKAFGLSEAAAREQAARGVIDEAWQTAVQSFLSGVMMSGITSMYGNAQSKKQEKQLQGTIQEAQQKILSGENTVSSRVMIREGTEVSEEIRTQAERISGVTGRQIELYDADSGEDGFYDKNTGILHINAKGKDPFAQIVSHELTHSVEMSEAYKEISSLVMKRIQQQGGNLEQLRQEKRQQYAKNGVQLQDNAEVDSEIVASYVARNLLTNEQEITSLARENPSLAQKVRDWLEGLLAKLGSSKAQERTFVKKARDAYARALEQTGGNVGQTENQMPNIADMMELKEWVNEQLRSGAWTEAEYESFLEEYEQYMNQAGVDPMAREDQRFGIQRDSKKKFSFAGENSKTADKGALARAMVMKNQGADNETIRKETGWFQGMEGKWRYEIDDSQMKYHRAGDARFSEMHPEYARHQELMKKWLYGKLEGQEEAEFRELDEIWGREYQRLSDRVRRGNATLQNIIQHDELFAAYPELQGARVKFENMEPGKRGQYDPNTNSITLSNELRNAPQDTLLHEVQHAIQDIEGFTGGASVEYWKEQRRDIVETIAAARKNLDLWLADIGYPEVNRQSLLAVSRREKPLAQHWKDMAEFKENSEFARQIAACEAELAEFQRQYDEITHGMNVYDQYENTAGEIEARNVAGRRNLTAEERKKTPPQLGDENTVFVDMEQRIESLDAEYGPADGNYQDRVIPQMEVEEGIQQVAAMAPVVTISGEEFAKGEKDLITQVSEYFDSLDNVAHNEQLGDVILDRKGVKSDLGHGMGRKKAASFAAVRDVIEQGRVVDYQVNWKDRGYDTAVVAAPINIGTQEHLAVVIMVRSNQTNRFYVHEVMTTENGAMPFKTGTLRKGTPSGDAPSAYSILGKIFAVKNENKNGASQVPDDKAPGRDVRNELASTPTDIVSDGSVGVNRKYSISDRNTQETKYKPINREELPAKARKYLESAERGLLNHIGKALGVPYHAKRDTLKPMIQELSNEYLSTGTISQESMDRLFEEAYEAGVVIDREFYDQYKHVKDHLRTTAVTISQKDQADIADFQDFRRRSFGTLRITKEGGMPVDSYYRELQEMAPELFPDHITHPADQLQRMLEVGQSIRVTEGSLDSYYGKYAQEYKAWQKNDFIAAINDDLAELRTVQRYAQEKNQFERESDEISVEEAAECWAQLKAARRNYEKVNARNLLSLHDEMQVGRLLRGEVLLEHLEGEENFKGIKAIFEAKQEYEKIAKQISRYKHQVRRKRLDRADELLKTANDWRDKKTGIQYSRETMRRNILDIVPDQKVAADVLKEYFEPVQHAEALSTKFKTEYRDKVRALNLNTKVTEGNEVSEAYAVQLLGEAMDNIRVMENARGRIRTRDGRTLTEWRALVQDMWEHSPNLDRAKIESAVKEFRKIYDELFQKMNRVRMENGYEPVNYRKGYFPHFQPSSDGDGIIAYFGKVLGIDTNVEALPTTINGLTHTFKPGIQWFGNAQERLGFKTAYDAVEGFDKYIEGVSSVIHHTENIQKLRALATQARYRTSDEGIREQVDAVQMDTRLTDEERQLKIREIYEKGKFALSNFVAELDEYTNLLANKKSRFDRTIEQALGRRIYTIMKNVESRVAANMIAGNISSAVTNFIPLTQAMGRIGSTELLRGMKDARRAIIGGTSDFVGMSDFLTNRRGSDVLVKGWSDKLSSKLGMPMELIDNFTSEAIVRAAYYQNIKRGMSESEAIHQADILAASIMADRSKGSMPTLFESSNPLFKALTQFQLEVNNQYSEIFKDMPREYAEQAKWVLALAFMKYFIGAFLFNELEEKIKGRRSAMDPIGIASNFLEDMHENGLYEASSNLTTNLLEGLPFTSALNVVGFELDGGRIPVASAIPDFSALGKALTGRNMTKTERLDTLVDELQKPIVYLALPVGGNQLSKTWKGVAAYIKGGSYGLDGDGEEILQYPIYKDEGGDAFWNLVKSMVFGKNSLGTAQAWVNDGFSSLNAKQTAVYQDMLEAGAKDRDAYELIDAIRRTSKPDTEDGGNVQRENRMQLIRESAMSDECKDIAYYGLIATDYERELMDALADAGASSGVNEFVSAYSDAKRLEGDAERIGLRDVICESSLTEQEKQVVMQYMLGPEEVNENGNLTKYGKYIYAVEQGMSTDDYMELYAKNVSVDKYLDMLDTGLSENGAMDLTRKLAELDTKDMTDTQKWKAECDAIMAAGLSERDQVAALVSVSYESTGRMFQIGYDHGIGPSLVLDFKRALPEFDANSNRNYSQKEVTAAIDAIAGNEIWLALTGGRVNLTNEQKAVLWQLQNSSWKPNKNPYDKEVGQYIYDLVKQMKESK